MTDDKMALETRALLPCPFCGGEARLYCVNLPMLGDCDDIQASCSSCDAIGPGVMFDQTTHGEGDIPELEAEAIAAWNTRSALTPAPLPDDVAEVVKRLERLAERDEAIGERLGTGGDPVFRKAATALASYASRLAVVQGERDAWKNRAAEHHRSVDAMHKRATTAEARAEAAERALEPFAALPPPLPRYPDSAECQRMVTAGDLRRARAILDRREASHD